MKRSQTFCFPSRYIAIDLWFVVNQNFIYQTLNVTLIVNSHTFLHLSRNEKGFTTVDTNIGSLTSMDAFNSTATKNALQSRLDRLVLAGKIGHFNIVTSSSADIGFPEIGRRICEIAKHFKICPSYVRSANTCTFFTCSDFRSYI